MFKGKNYLYPNAIVDFNLKILDSNSFFNDFFKHKKDWDKISIKITDLIEFDDLNEFKKSLNSLESTSHSNSSFNGKMKIGELSEPIKITISQIENKDQKWSNQAVEIICEKINSLTPESNYTNLVLENSSTKIFVVNLSYHLTFFSKSSTALLKIILGKEPKNGGSFLPKQIDSEEWKNYFDIIFSGEKMFLEKNYQVGKKEFYDLLTLSALKNENGEIVGCTVYANDILALKKAEALNYQNHKKYQYLFDNNLLGIGVLDEKSNLIQANDSFRHLVGLENNNFEQSRVTDFFEGEDLNLVTTKMKQIYRKEISHYTCELKFKNTRNEYKYIQVGINGFYKNNKFSGCLFSVLDISSQKEIQFKEQELKELKTRESINLEHQLLLQQELDSRIRELTSNQLLIAQKNNLIKELNKKLAKAVRKSDGDLPQEIRKIIDFINRQNVFENDWENLKIHFVKMHPSFFDKINKRSPKITQNELRHCAYVKLGFSAKETSDLLGTLPRSIEQARFRIKKKLNLPSDQKLKDYLRNI